MRLVQFTNNAKSRLNANLTAGGTSLSITPGDGSKFPALTGSAYFYCTLVKSDGTAEIIKVTARSGDNFTIQRAVEPINGVSTAYAFSAGDRIEVRLTAMGFLNELDRVEELALMTVSTKTSAYTVTENDLHSLINVSTASGSVTITLPQISSLNADFDTIIAKISADTNLVNIVRSGSDTINGSTSFSLSVRWQCAWLVADKETNAWTVINSGPVAGNNIVVDTMTGSGGVPTIILSGNPGSKNNTSLFIGGVYQHKSTYTYSGNAITAGGAVAAGVPIEVIWSEPTTIGVPGDLTVSAGKLQPEVAASLVPAGAVAHFAMATPPTGWIKANGATVSRSTYAALFAAIGTTFGAGDGTTTFTLPDLRNRMAIGSDSLYVVGATGGSKDAIVVSHTHSVSVSDPGHSHTLTSDGHRHGTSGRATAGNFWTSDGDSAVDANTDSQDTSGSGTGISVSLTTTGASGTNANLPPYMGLLACIKY